MRPRGGAGDFTATWIGHATTLIQVGGLNVITDPVFCDRAFPVQWIGPRRVMPPGLAREALPPIDVVLLSICPQIELPSCSHWSTGCVYTLHSLYM